MSRTVYVNGQFCAEEQAQISIFDRGLLFADAIYEVAGVLEGKLMDFPRHMARMDRSLAEMGIAAPLSHDEVLKVMRDLVSLNAVEAGIVYMQITRGSDGDRDYLPAQRPSRPTVLMFTQEQELWEIEALAKGISLASAEDIRWARRDIKTTNLMGSVFAKRRAQAAGADEVLMHENGIVTEGGSTSVYIIKDGVVITRPLSRDILHGCTRGALLSLIAESDVQLQERPFTLEEAYDADEAFLTAAASYVCPIIRIDDAVLGDGMPGLITKKLQNIYHDYIRANLT